MRNEFLIWLKAAAVRAIKTMAQTALGMLSGEMMGIMDVDWMAVASVSAVAGLASILTSVAGLPEVNNAKINTGGDANT